MKNLRKIIKKMTALSLAAVLAAGSINVAVYADEPEAQPVAAEEAQEGAGISGDGNPTVENSTAAPEADAQTAEAGNNVVDNNGAEASKAEAGGAEDVRLFSSSGLLGHRKCPSHKTFEISRNPSPSHKMPLMRSVRRPQKRNRVPLSYGSSRYFNLTSEASPVIPYLRSVRPHARYTFLNAASGASLNMAHHLQDPRKLPF